MLRLENVTKIYDGGVVAVKDVALDINKGEFVFLVGPSGSGKSTIASQLAELLGGIQIRSDVERKRLFELPRSSWDDYEAKLISKGGGIFRRAAKSIRPQVIAMDPRGASAQR